MLFKKLMLKKLYSRKIVPFEIPGTARELTEEEKLMVNGGTVMSEADRQKMAEAGARNDTKTQEEIKAKYETKTGGQSTPTTPSTPATPTTASGNNTTKPKTNTNTSGSSGTGGSTGSRSGSGSGNSTVKSSSSSSGSGSGSSSGSTGGSSSSGGSSVAGNGSDTDDSSEETDYYTDTTTNVDLRKRNKTDHKKNIELMTDWYDNSTIGQLEKRKRNAVAGKKGEEKEIKGWKNNGDGTHTVTAEGATLWDLYGPNWRELSHYEGDPTKLHVGDTVGKKIKVNPGAGDMTVTEMIEREKKKGATSSPVKAPEPPLEQKTLRKEEVFSLCLNTFYEAYKIKTPGARFCDKLLSSQNSLNSSGGSLFGSLEKGIGDAGNASYILSKTTSDVSGLEGISNTMGKTSGYLGLSSAIIDFCQVLKEPSVANSRDLIVSTWGLADPVTLS